MMMMSLHGSSSSSSSISLLLLLLVMLCTATQHMPPDDDVEKAFLSMLGLPAKPIPKGPIQVPQRMKELYEQLNNLERGSFDKELELRKQVHKRSVSSVYLPGNTVRSFYFQGDEDSQAWDPKARSFRFDVDALPSSETLHRAELHVLRRQLPVNSSNGEQHGKMRLYHVLSNNSSNSRQHEVMVDTKPLPPASAERWHTLDVTGMVKQWRAVPHSNHGLRLEIVGDSAHATRLRRSADIAPDEWLRQQPYLVTYTDDRDIETQDKARDKHERDTQHRRRRRRRSRTPRSKKNRRRRRKRICRRHSLLVDFKEVGWDSWIVAPPDYDAYYCHGECPFALSDNLNTTNHAVVQSLVHSMNPEAVPKPCCVPTELSAFSLLYVNTNGTVVLKTYQEMVVEACGCR